jgi:hypothetical protein
MALRVVPLTLREANDLVAKLHRHHRSAVGHRFSLGVRETERGLVGACIVGRPVSRKYDPACIAEVTRLVTDGTKNACSILYAAAARAAHAMGFEAIQTYILEHEPGTSLRAAGWTREGLTDTADWHSQRQLLFGGAGRSTPKQRWRKVFTLPRS